MDEEESFGGEHGSGEGEEFVLVVGEGAEGFSFFCGRVGRVEGEEEVIEAGLGVGDFGEGFEDLRVPVFGGGGDVAVEEGEGLGDGGVVGSGFGDDAVGSTELADEVVAAERGGVLRGPHVALGSGAAADVAHGHGGEGVSFLCVFPAFLGEGLADAVGFLPVLRFVGLAEFEVQVGGFLLVGAFICFGGVELLVEADQFGGGGGEEFEDALAVGGPLVGEVLVDLVIDVAVGEDEEGVMHFLGPHAAEFGALEGEDGAGGDFLERCGALEEAGVVEDALEIAGAVVDARHDLFEVGEDFGVGGFGFLGPVVDGVDEAVSEGAVPEAVGEDLGEVGVAAGDPAGEGLAAVFGGDVAELLAEESGGGDFLAGVSVLVLVVFGELDGFVGELGDFVLVEVLEDDAEVLVDFAGKALVGIPSAGGVLLAFFSFGSFGRCGWVLFAVVFDQHLDGVAGFLALVGDAAAEGGEFVILHLRPAVEGMVVALGATDLVAEEDLHRVADVVEEHAAVAEVVSDGGVLGGVAVGGEHFVNHVVPGFVLGEGFAEPDVPAESILFLVRLEAKEVGEVVEGSAVVAGRGDEGFDQLGAFIGGIAIEKADCFLRGGDATDDAEVVAPEEDVVGDEEVRGELFCGEIGFDELVDLGGDFEGFLERERLGCGGEGEAEDQREREEMAQVHEVDGWVGRSFEEVVGVYALFIRSPIAEWLR